MADHCHSLVQVVKSQDIGISGDLRFNSEVWFIDTDIN